ncbi:hypothetical protein [Salarchaeum japonicum]|uniref:hypothetical protein n=1 Tax=Salarchaeum japonicum TaxID=555573 RepID=UPI003C72AEA1
MLSPDPWADDGDGVAREYEQAVVYADYAQDTVLHDGPARLLSNGWVQIPSGRLLSPDAIHHIDPFPEDSDTSR